MWFEKFCRFSIKNWLIWCMEGLCSTKTQRDMQEIPRGNNSTFQTLENHHIFKIAFFDWFTISRSILTLQTPTIYQIIANYLRNPQNFSDLSYEVYVRRYELPNNCHFFPSRPYLDWVGFIWAMCYWKSDLYKYSLDCEKSISEPFIEYVAIVLKSHSC